MLLSLANELRTPKVAFRNIKDASGATLIVLVHRVEFLGNPQQIGPLFEPPGEIRYLLGVRFPRLRAAARGHSSAP